MERYRGGRGMQSLDTKLKCWNLTSPPLPGWPQSPQGAGGKGVESRQTQAGAWLICLGLWLSRKACQSKTTGRKAWLLAEVCGRQDGPWAAAGGLEEPGCLHGCQGGCRWPRIQCPTACVSHWEATQPA